MLGYDDIWGKSYNLNKEAIIFNIYEKAKTDGIQMGKKIWNNFCLFCNYFEELARNETQPSRAAKSF